ncbi:MAG: hypothetical protein ACLS69_03215 [Butyricicoccus sp.]
MLRGNFAAGGDLPLLLIRKSPAGMAGAAAVREKEKLRLPDAGFLTLAIHARWRCSSCANRAVRLPQFIRRKTPHSG